MSCCSFWGSRNLDLQGVWATTRHTNRGFAEVGPKRQKSEEKGGV